MLRLIFASILTMSVTGGILLLFIFMLRPVTTKVFSAAWNYYVNLIVLVFLLIPIGLVPGKIFMNNPSGWVVLPAETNPIVLDHLQDNTINAAAGIGLLQAYQRTKPNFDVDDPLSYLFWVWILGMVIFIAHNGRQFLIFKRKLLETSVSVEEDDSIYQIYQECRSDLGVRQKINLLYNDKIEAPMVTGLIKPCLILPRVDMDRSELRFILNHELIHCKRKDLWFKATAWFTNAVHWFNPLIYKMVQDINEFCEMSCDEAVVKDMSMRERHFYGQSILNILSRVINKQEGIYSNLCESEKGLKRRLILIMQKKNFSRKTAAVSIVVFMAICITGSALAYKLVPSDEKVSEDMSWETSLDKLDSKALFADIVAKNNIDKENIDEFGSALEQFLLAIAQHHKSSIQEPAVEALTVPVPAARISSMYGQRYHPVTKEYKLHSGIDYSQKAGADIIAANAGKVVATQDDLGGSVYYGNYIVIVHNDGTACLYAHCSVLAVKTGDRVNKGDKIAEVGSTGIATGPHCHFEFRLNGKPIDPTPHIAATE
ncbi:MAG: M56 family metallopeptidase [Syntrophomonas sp.]